MYGIDKAEIQLAVAEHRRWLAAESKASMAQQTHFRRQWRRSLGWLGLTLIACGQRLTTWSTQVSAQVSAQGFHQGS